MKDNESLPNILILVPDEFRGDCINNLGVKMPNIDKLREDNAATFLNNFSVNPVCGPSRCCTFTGQYVHDGGHRSLYQLLAPHEENLFQLLKHKGYEVVWIGRNDLFYKRSVKQSVSKRVKLLKATISKISKAIPFKTLLKVMGKGIRFLLKGKGLNELSGLVDMVSDYYKINPWPMDHRLRNSFYFGERTKVQADLDPDGVITEKSLNYLERKMGKQKKPFCLYVPFNFPHPPYTVEEPYFSMHDRGEIQLFPPVLDDKPEFMRVMRERYGLNNLDEDDFKEIRATYYGMITKLDSQIGKIIEKLKEIGKYENTAIFLFADHGDYTGDYGLTEKWPNGMQDCLLKVPLIVKIPGITPGTKNQDQLTQTIDIFATIIEIANIETPYTHFSKSLVPAMQGKEESHREFVFAEGGYDPREPQCFEDPMGPPENNMTGIYYEKTHIPLERPELVGRTAMIRTRDWKLVLRNTEGQKEELYDLKEDPGELKNLIDDPSYKEKIRELKEKLLRFYIETSDNPSWEHQRDV